MDREREHAPWGRGAESGSDDRRRSIGPRLGGDGRHVEPSDRSRRHHGVDVNGVHVVTDSTAYLPPDLASSLGIEQVSLYWDLGEGPSRELEYGGDYGKFYQALEAAATVATTSPPTVEDFLVVYERALSQFEGVVSVHITAGLSETCTAAETAARKLAADGKGGERITVLDSAAVGGQLGLLAMAAANAAHAGLDSAGVAQRVRQARQEARTWFLLDTFEYLRRGGRVGAAVAWIGSTLNIKPILETGTELRAVERVRTRQRGLERLIEFGRQQAARGADAWCVQHSRAEDEAILLADRLREVYRRPPEFIAEVGPVVGTHGGPGVIGLGSMPSRFLDSARTG
jgi:DegV family protein with EDD domain